MPVKAALTMKWLGHYVSLEIQRWLRGERVKPRHIYFAICDHFEPFWHKATAETARARIQRWLSQYPKIADKHRDSDGNVLKYTFFYPEEEYRFEDLDAVAGLCQAGFGEVEIHLHHHLDNPENLRCTLMDYKQRLYERHGLLSQNQSGEVTYGFIHGNWALNNSRPDGCWCGVDNETEILLGTGCYADFTMPSAPSATQTSKLNSIYYALPAPRPKSHDWGIDAEVAKGGEGLLMVQGPLCPTFRRRKFGVLPRIENSGLMAGVPVDRGRVLDWLNARVHVKGAPDSVFIKLYTHGTQEKIMQSFFDRHELDTLLSLMVECAESLQASLHFVSAREMVNIIKALEMGVEQSVQTMRNLYLMRQGG